MMVGASAGIWSANPSISVAQPSTRLLVLRLLMAAARARIASRSSAGAIRQSAISLASSMVADDVEAAWSARICMAPTCTA
jgi:hypothetical protein